MIGYYFLKDRAWPDWHKKAAHLTPRERECDKPRASVILAKVLVP
jgi:hypothetical protein